MLRSRRRCDKDATVTKGFRREAWDLIPVNFFDRQPEFVKVGRSEIVRFGNDWGPL
jgi:hypothetical protein